MASPKIEPFDESGHRTGRLPSKLTPGEISKRLGFAPNIDDDPYKVVNSWGFKIDGVPCAIWDYKGCRWSTYGPHEVMLKVFPEHIKERDV